ncbi:MAG: ATP-dependent Zn protease [Leptolyngbyaceae cyanobacterium bins.59]|nr:ATP-dependent Zn protease [Leptolyngbyaceae cyanobacterium bins.59]
MNPLTLNLIAISIFTITLTSLVGPLFHIPPTVPAGITAIVLGFATIDSLGWQGRGGDLVIDWLTRAFGGKDYQDRIIHHEAGHFLVAALLEIPVTGYTLNAWEALRQGQPGLGGVTFDTQALEAAMQPHPGGDDRLPVRVLLDRYCTVWMAGIAAETLVYGDSQGGSDDRQKFQSLGRSLQWSSEIALQYERRAILQAKTLLQNHQATYEALVECMTQRATVEICYQVIGPTRQS